MEASYIATYGEVEHTGRVRGVRKRAAERTGRGTGWDAHTGAYGTARRERSMQVAECDGGTCSSGGGYRPGPSCAPARSLYPLRRREAAVELEQRAAGTARAAAIGGGVEPHRERVRRQPEPYASSVWVGSERRRGVEERRRERWSTYGGTASGGRRIASPVSARRERSMQIAECDGGTVHDAAVVTDRGHAAHQRGPSTLYGGERRRWVWNSERRREAAVEPHREPVRRQPEQRVGVMGRSGGREEGGAHMGVQRAARGGSHLQSQRVREMTHLRRTRPPGKERGHSWEGDTLMMRVCPCGSKERLLSQGYFRKVTNT